AVAVLLHDFLNAPMQRQEVVNLVVDRDHDRKLRAVAALHRPLALIDRFIRLLERELYRAPHIRLCASSTTLLSWLSVTGGDVALLAARLSNRASAAIDA